MTGTPPRNILIAHPFPDVYGADRVALEVAIALREAGMNPMLVLPEPGPMTAWLDEHALAYRCVTTPVLRRALMSPRGVLGLASTSRRDFSRVARTIAEINPALVYTNTITLPHWVLGARRARLPVIAHIHESDDRLRPALARALAAPLLAANRVIAVSNATEQFLARAVPRLSGRTQVIYNGLDAPAVGRPSSHGSSTVRLAVIGRLSANKGQDLAIAAMGMLHKRGRSVHLEIAGATFSGYEGIERALRASVLALGLGDRVTFSGFCGDVWELLRRTDIVLAPSRTDSFPLVVIEAMLAGKPVVAADVGGMGELIQDGVSGFLVGREDVAALVTRIERLIDDPQLALRMGARARSDAMERFSRERFNRQIVAVVEEVLDGARGSSRHARGMRLGTSRRRRREV